MLRNRLALIGFLAFTLACDDMPESIVIPSALNDPQLVRADRSAPFTDFGGSGGSVVLGSGWTRPELTWSRLAGVPLIRSL